MANLVSFGLLMWRNLRPHCRHGADFPY